MANWLKGSVNSRNRKAYELFEWTRVPRLDIKQPSNCTDRRNRLSIWRFAWSYGR
jgi:hypothetical protein